MAHPSWPILDPAPRRIAVLRALQLGDLLVAVPALRALRRTYPQAEITLIGLPWAATFAARFRHLIDHFAVFPGAPGILEAEYDAKRTEAFLAEQRALGYDLAVQLHGSGQQSMPFTLALGARVTVGFAPAPLASLNRWRAYPDDLPEVQRLLAAVELAGCSTQDVALEWPISAEERSDAARLLAHLPRPRVGLHAGARAPSRRWPPDRFAAVANALAREWNASIILTGSAEEIETVAAVDARLRTDALNLAGRTTLGSLAAVIADLDLFISNDTGPAHLAEAVGTPSITIFGPAELRRWAPLDATKHTIVRHPVACRPCGFWECPIGHPCLRGITPMQVIAAARALRPREQLIWSD